MLKSSSSCRLASLEEPCCSKNSTHGVFEFFLFKLQNVTVLVVSALIMCMRMCEECSPYLCFYDVKIKNSLVSLFDTSFALAVQIKSSCSDRNKKPAVVL